MAQKYEVVVNGSITLRADGMAWGYPQTDGEGSGATDENVMYRERLPDRYTFKITFNYPDETVAQKILQVRGMTGCSVDYYDVMKRSRVTRQMYPVGDDIGAAVFIDGNFVFDPYELRFVQTIPDS